MPRRYHVYPEEFQVLNVHVLGRAPRSWASATCIPMVYFAWSMRYGKIAPGNPWDATGLEWQTTSPPPTENFAMTPVVDEEAYDYALAAEGGRPLSDAHAAAPALQHHFDEPRAAEGLGPSLGMWVFIAQEILFFGGLFAAYTVYRNLYHDAFAAGSHHLDWKLGRLQHRWCSSAAA